MWWCNYVFKDVSQLNKKFPQVDLLLGNGQKVQLAPEKLHVPGKLFSLFVFNIGSLYFFSICLCMYWFILGCVCHKSVPYIHDINQVDRLIFVFSSRLISWKYLSRRTSLYCFACAIFWQFIVPCFSPCKWILVFTIIIYW